jgi:TPR repeat protein
VGDGGSALAEGLYWMAEKLTWGYEGVDKDPASALRLLRQAADLGFSDAHIRIGHFKNMERALSATPAQPSLLDTHRHAMARVQATLA